MFLSWLAKLLVPISGKLFEMIFDLIANLVNDWLEERKEDQTDKRVKNEAKNPDRSRAARDLDGSFNGGQ